MKKRDILFLCQFFYPEYNSSATLPFDTAKSLSEAGFSVGAMCGYPREYSNIKRVPLKETESGVNIRRLKYIQVKRTSKIGRLINYFSFSFAVLFNIFRIKKYRSVIVYSNPPILPMAAVLANILFGTKIIFVSYDVYPEVAYASGSIADTGVIARMMRRINRSLFKRASAVVALTDEMKAFLENSRPQIEADRIVVIPNWAHEKAPSSSSPEKYSKFGYSPDDFIVSYFGNMGICQDVETLIGAIRMLTDHDKIKFMIAGHGSKLEYVRDSVAGLKNVSVLDFLSGDDFRSAVSISSCGVVSLEKGLIGMCAPSKYYSYLQGGIPVLAVVEPKSYLAKETEEEQTGAAVELGDSKALAEKIVEMSECRSACADMSRRAAALYEEKYSMKTGLDKYTEMFRKLLLSNPCGR